MAENLQQEVENLLKSSGAAHHEYESSVLQGVYDADWASWYAAWLIEQGLNELLGTDLAVPALSQMLADLNNDLKQANTGENWAQFTARRLVESYMNG